MAGVIIALVVVLGLLALVAIIVIGIYNGLVGARNQVDNAWAQIDVQLKRRHDLIPNLVETAKGYMKHERDTFEAITKARAAAMGAKTVSETSQTEGQLADALSKFMLVVENYPELKANQNFLALQEELTATEGRVAYARQFYNDSVLSYNNRLQVFPTVIIAKMLNFERREYFEAEEGARTVPTVEF
jgi:LemA protein